MKEKLEALWGKVVENKHIVIPVATAIVGGLIGAAITNAVLTNMQNESLASYPFFEEDATQVDLPASE